MSTDVATRKARGSRQVWAIRVLGWAAGLSSMAAALAGWPTWQGALMTLAFAFGVAMAQRSQPKRSQVEGGILLALGSASAFVNADSEWPPLWFWAVGLAVLLGAEGVRWWLRRTQ